MIKKIYFKKLNSLQQDFEVLEFSKKNNIIIGPKGSGKSTLFDLLAGLEKGFIYENVIKAFESFNFEFVKIEKFNGEEIHYNQLTQKKEKEKIEDYRNRNDVIYQDDEIKKNLNSSLEIEKKKITFLKKTLSDSKYITEFIKQINSLYKEIKEINLLNSNDINWSNIFKINKVESDYKFFFSLNYQNDKLIIELDELSEKLMKIFENTDDQIRFHNQNKELDFNNVKSSKEFTSSYIKELDEILTNHKNLKKIIWPEIIRIQKIKLASNIFEISFKNRIEKFKTDNLKVAPDFFKTQSMDYFKKNAKQLVRTINLLKNFIKETYILNIEESSHDDNFLSYKLNSKIEFSEEDIESILKSVFYTPKETSNIFKWINENREKLKEFSEDKILTALSKVLKKEVIVLANGKDYKTMSLGERSIYGIEYKFSNSKNHGVFLDQPEDNLDNYTIADKMIDLIKTKKDYQNFIVTHNANVGILSDVDRIIVSKYDADNEEKFLYKGENIVSIIKNKENHSALNYLEGGYEALEKRYNILIKGK